MEDLKAYAEAAVQAGVSLLDKYFGNNSWRTRINLDSLYMGDVRDCVLGQVFDAEEIGAEYFSGFEYGLSAFGLSDAESAQYGFSATDEHERDKSYSSWWEILGDAWKAELSA